MAKQKFGLGRGLDALISGASQVISTDKQGITTVALEHIIPNPRQPRKLSRDDDPRLLELSESIKEYGLIQPLVVTRLDKLPVEMQPTSLPAADDWFNDGSSPTRAQEDRKSVV